MEITGPSEKKREGERERDSRTKHITTHAEKILTVRRDIKGGREFSDF